MGVYFWALSSIPLIYLHIMLPMVLAIASSMMLKRNGRHGHPHLSDLSRKTCKFLTITHGVSCRGLHLFFMRLTKSPSIPSLLRVFIMNGCQILSNVSFASIAMFYFFSVYCFFSLMLDYIN